MSPPEAHLSPHAARKPGIAMSAGTTPKLTMLDLLREQCSRDASDLLLTAGAPPQLRVNGALTGVGDQPLDAESVRRLAASVLNEAQQRELQTRMDFDFSLGIEGLSRFRIHIYQQRGSMAVAVRMIPHRVPAFESLGIPAIARDFASRPNGLVLVTGPTGSGKSTTLAAMIDLINHARHAHIVCIEDPIEYLHHHELSIVEQREVARDTHGFADALRAVFRETPDVIMVGEMRDLETISLALTLAETGHLILATLHTQDTSHAITRIVDAFPADQQAQVAMQLSLVLIGVLAQQLIPSADGRRRVLATEVMHVNSAIRSLIRERQVQQIYSVIQTGSREGMVTMTDALFALCQQRTISPEMAMQWSPRPKEMLKLLEERVAAAGRGRAR
jgi:twitching motility protein PilT